MTNDDLLYRHRVQLFALAQTVGVNRACRELGYHRSSYYRWRPSVLRHGLEILRPRERRPPRMPNQVPPWLEERVVAFSLGHPGLGPRRVAAQLALPMWGGLRISASGTLKGVTPARPADATSPAGAGGGLRGSCRTRKPVRAAAAASGGG